MAVLLAATLRLVQAGHLIVPAWVTWESTELEVDFDGNGSPKRVTLDSGSLAVSAADGTSLYQTPDDWRVARVSVGDVDQNGADELLMLTWRRGNYGTSRPFWETGIDLRMTEHLYVLEMRDGAMVPKWMSHELGAPVASVTVQDDGTVVLTTTDGVDTTWCWEGFGFILT